MKNTKFLLFFIFLGCAAGNKTVVIPESNPREIPNQIENITNGIRSVETKKEVVFSSRIFVVLFNFDESLIRGDQFPQIVQAAKKFQETENAILIEGHCDERGTIEYNYALGQRRATEVAKSLVRLGADRRLISTISYGEDRPLRDGHDEFSYTFNRRAEFEVK